MPIELGSSGFNVSNRGWRDPSLDQQSSSYRPGGDNTTSMSVSNREFKERSEAIQRGGQQASGYYHRSIRNEDARRSDFDVVPEQTFGSSVNVTEPQMSSRRPGLEEGQLPGQSSEANRPSGDYTTSLSHTNREFKERPGAIQRGNLQASGSYRKTIRNEDARRSGFDMVPEETSAEQNSPSQHPIQRGHTQASGSFDRTIPNDDLKLSDPWNDRTPVSSQAPSTREWIFQQPQRDQTTNYYWSSRRDADDVEGVSRRGHQGHMTTSGQATTEPTWTTIHDADQTSTKVLDRVFEWEPTTEGHSSPHTNLPILSQRRQEEREPEVQNQNQNPDVLLQPRSLMPGPATSRGQNINLDDGFSPHQESPSQDFLNSTASANGGQNFNQATNAPAPLQTLPSVPPAPVQYAPPTMDALEKREKEGTLLANLILLGVVILCFLLAGATVVILVTAI